MLFNSKLLPFFTIFAVLCWHTVDAADVGKWRRHVVSLQNSSYSGNPFELEVDGTFTHTASGTTIKLPGFYAGNSVWKIGFMPNKLGEWTYTTTSGDPDLNGKTGSLTCIASGHPGMLKADPSHRTKWKYTDGPYAVPVALRFNLAQSGSDAQMIAAADFIANSVKGQLYEFRLHDPSSGNNVFSNVSGHQFNLTLWDRLEKRMEMLAARGVGYHCMLYSDDAARPSWSGQSATEKLYIRYLVARIAGFPTVWYNTGIDIGEYRSTSWVDWFGQQTKMLDPYGHPVSNRYGGGSGSRAMAGQTFDSRGHNQADISVILGFYQQASVPVSMDDAWGENRTSRPAKDHRPADIRRAFWKCAIAGGTGGLVRSSAAEDRGFLMSDIQSDLESEQWLRHINPFIANKIGDTYGAMEPASALVSGSGVYCMADNARTKLFYFLMGSNDRYNSGGGAVTVRLSSISGKSYTAKWFDTRTGSESSAGTLTSGQDHTLNPPSTDDWVLLLDGVPPDNTPPSAPSGLGATPKSESRIDLAWNPAADNESGISLYNIYRDNVKVGTATSTSYSDMGLSENTAYTYQVSAVNGAGTEGPKSNTVTGTTMADNTPPDIVSADAAAESQVTVVFSEPVDGAGAENKANYSINNNITISSAALGPDNVTVTLITSVLTKDVNYTLTVNNVRDRAKSPNTIAANTTAGFVYEGKLVITSLNVTSGKTYVWDTLATGKSLYIDRSYTVASAPQELLGKQFLKTANDDKAGTGSSFLTFDVNLGVEVLVGVAGGSPLSWMNGWENTGQSVSGSHGITYTLFKKGFPAGTVVLGGNQGSGGNMYTVIVSQDAGPVVELANNMTSSADLAMDVFPNPFNLKTTIVVNNGTQKTENGKGKRMELKIYDINGKMVKDLTPGIPNSSFVIRNFFTFYLQAESLSPGVYFIHAVIGKKSLITKVTLMK
jgi:fibronectin type 3 domain-containing protein